ncbi:MAG TPA: CHAD domain-containing protein [Alphaproteobacteria bacterium]|nr:CHAD domain-containing protein [Alphaproteobacteria bacterium]
MEQEFELKLAMSPEHVERLRRHPMLRTHKQRGGSTKRLVSVYYDTPAFALLRKAVALRVRKVGGEHIQTIKREAGNGKSRFARREWERRIEGDGPDLSGLEDRELKRLIAPHKERGDLRPVFTTEVMRQTWPLRVGASRIECALDIGEIKSDGRSQPVCEVELELKSGAPAGLFELARRLNKSVPLRLDPMSKAERGYHLAANATPGPKKAEPVHLDPEMSVREAFGAIARACITHILSNVGCAHDGKDPEGVHQLRVGIRRLRAAFAVFQDAIAEGDRAALGGELRWLQRELGPAREWDVFLSASLPAVYKRFGTSDGLETLRATAEAVRRRAYQRCRAALHNRRYTDLLLRLEAWLDGGLDETGTLPTNGTGRAPEDGLQRETLDAPILEFSAAILKGRHVKAAKLGDRLRKLDERQLHELRIRVKKLRYATEFFRDLYTDKSAKRYVAALKAIQEALGDANDALVANDLMGELDELAGSDGEVALRQLQAWASAAIKRDRKRLEHLWDDFRELKAFWKSG